VRSRTKGIAPAKSDEYFQTFIEHVHQLVWHGYSQLKHSTLSSLHEPAISGQICEQIEKYMDDPKASVWVSDYEIHDDPPVHDKSRDGKNRRRVDIKLASRRSRPRTRFCFEAKCLNKKSGAADYLGKDGLGQFVTASYAATESHAGMLAYVQSEDCDAWCEKIQQKVDNKKHRLSDAGHWKAISITRVIQHCYQTIHTRPRKLPNVVVLHTLLDCTSAN